MKVTDLILDEHNANLGTERGKEMLAESLKEYGAGRSILVDKEGRIIAGNKTVEQAIEAGIEDLLVIETDGSQLVAVKRLDLDLNNGSRARELAYADNRVGQIDLDWNPDQLLSDLEDGPDLSELFRQDELDRLLGRLPEIDYDELWQGMPEFEQEDKTSFRSIRVHFRNQEDVTEFASVINQNITGGMKSIWYPEAILIDMTDIYVEP